MKLLSNEDALSAEIQQLLRDKKQMADLITTLQAENKDWLVV